MPFFAIRLVDALILRSLLDWPLHTFETAKESSTFDFPLKNSLSSEVASQKHS